MESAPSNNNGSVHSRLTALLQQEAGHAGGYPALADRILEANAQKIIPKKFQVNHQKLRAIGKRKLDRPLYCDEIEALETYFRSRGISFTNELFQPSTLLEALAASGPVAFLLPARDRHRERRVDMSEWDVKALAEFTYRLGQLGARQPQITVQEVPHRPEVFRKHQPNLKDAKWFELLNTHQGSIVSISSPRASHATEWMLAEMLGLKPFRTPRDPDGMPFLFVWPGERHFRSAVAVTPAMLKRSKKLAAAGRHLSGDVWALLVKNQPHRVQRSGSRERKEYGVLVAQRRAAGWWVCVAGCTGSATFGVARAAREYICDVSPAADGQSADAVWAAVEVLVSPTRTAADPREVKSQRILYRSSEGTAADGK